MLSRDLLDVQDEIAERLLAGLKLRLTAEEQEQIERPLTRSSEAYEFYLRGRDALFRYILRTHDEADLDQAVKMMHEAIGLDPEFARAHATLGRCYVLYAQGWGGAENFVLAERSLRHALAVDPTHRQRAPADGLRGPAPRGQGQGPRPRRGAAAARRRTTPRCSSWPRWSTAWTASTRGRSRLYDRLLEVNPKDIVLVASTRRGSSPTRAASTRRSPRSSKGRAAEPEHPLLKTFLAVALFNQGMVDDAQALIEDVLRQNPHFDGVLPLLAWCLSARGQHEQARALVTDRVREIATADHDIAFWLASFYAMEGMADDALEWVRLAVRIGNENYPLFAAQPEARPPARRPALRRAPRGAAAALGERAAARRSKETA